MSLEVQNKLRQFNINVKFSMFYSPQLNPKEEFFSMFKNKFKAIN
ncbi:hypothetical protein H312_02993 [Anncaliia algerae PRA339]|uniref:Tc1-like transposase DDE domain-containing protein n=1 Tax=Anncaliia algerae PRA339 TaxID=1288291 RepID=A0A059EXI8_9MICR|nr:hypothetical protein H312_02993 [Anncaliia algerae PRA339]